MIYSSDLAHVLKVLALLFPIVFVLAARLPITGWMAVLGFDNWAFWVLILMIGVVVRIVAIYILPPDPALIQQSTESAQPVRPPPTTTSP